jgi:hypothetical protein
MVRPTPSPPLSVPSDWALWGFSALCALASGEPERGRPRDLCESTRLPISSPFRAKEERNEQASDEMGAMPMQQQQQQSAAQRGVDGEDDGAGAAEGGGVLPPSAPANPNAGGHEICANRRGCPSALLSERKKPHNLMGAMPMQQQQQQSAAQRGVDGEDDGAGAAPRTPASTSRRRRSERAPNRVEDPGWGWGVRLGGGAVRTDRRSSLHLLLGLDLRTFNFHHHHHYRRSFSHNPRLHYPATAAYACLNVSASTIGAGAEPG